MHACVSANANLCWVGGAVTAATAPATATRRLALPRVWLDIERCGRGGPEGAVHDAFGEVEEEEWRVAPNAPQSWHISTATPEQRTVNALLERGPRAEKDEPREAAAVIRIRAGLSGRLRPPGRHRELCSSPGSFFLWAGWR